MDRGAAIGEGMSRRQGRQPSVKILQGSALLLLACATSAPWLSCAAPPRSGIQSADVNERILAIHAAAEAGDKQSVPLLVDRLEDEDEAVRFYAILALAKITGKRMGYDYASPPSERAKAVERWRRSLRAAGQAHGERAAPPRASGSPTDARGSAARTLRQ
jgi:HEAT repeat protein